MIVFPAVAFAETVAPDGTTFLPADDPERQGRLPARRHVTLTGSGWQPGESVNIVVNDDAGQTWNRNVNVTADASGNITDQFNLPDWFVATYSVKATGASAAVATTTFTDASVTVHRGPTGNPPNVTFTVSFARFNDSSCTGSGRSTPEPP